MFLRDGKIYILMSVAGTVADQHIEEVYVELEVLSLPHSIPFVS